MEVQKVVRKAIEYMADLFSDEKLTNIGLEEVIFDETKKCWEVTVGFSRPWDYPKNTIITGLVTPNPQRQFKIVKVSECGEILGIKIRD